MFVSYFLVLFLLFLCLLFCFFIYVFMLFRLSILFLFMLFCFYYACFFIFQNTFVSFGSDRGRLLGRGFFFSWRRANGAEKRTPCRPYCAACSHVQPPCGRDSQRQDDHQVWQRLHEADTAGLPWRPSCTRLRANGAYRQGSDGWPYGSAA